MNMFLWEDNYCEKGVAQGLFDEAGSREIFSFTVVHKTTI